MGSNSKSFDCAVAILQKAILGLLKSQLLHTECVPQDPFRDAKQYLPDRINDVEASAGLYGIFFYDKAGEVKGLKVGISNNLKSRLKTHFSSLDSGLKTKDGLPVVREYSGGPDGVVSKKSILAMHLFFDNELSGEFGMNFRNQEDRRKFLRSQCFLLVRGTHTKEEAKTIENALEKCGYFRYVGKVKQRP